VWEFVNARLLAMTRTTPKPSTTVASTWDAHSVASSRRAGASLAVSRGSNLRFSRKHTSPGAKASRASHTASPDTPGSSGTEHPANSSVRAATGARLKCVSSGPSGLPKWLARTTEAPFSLRNWSVGRKARILPSSVMLWLSSGTLASTRRKMTRPSRSSALSSVVSATT